MNNKPSRTFGIGLLSASIMIVGLSPLTAIAHDEKDPRHQAMEGLAHAMKAISDTVKTGTPIDDGTHAHANSIRATAERMLALFPEGSGGGHSRAKPEIWSDWTGFSAKAEEFENAAHALMQATRSGDNTQVGAALKAVGATCGGCHKPYRKPKTH